MWVCLHLDPSRSLRWHLWLKQALSERAGVHITCSLSTQIRPLPMSCRLLLELERMIYGSRGIGATDPVGIDGQATHDPGGVPDLVIDLAAQGAVPAGRRVLTPSFNGVPGEIGLVAAVFEEETVRVEIIDTDRPGHPWISRPASTDSQILAASMDGALSCTIPLLLKAIETGDRPQQDDAMEPPRLSSPWIAGPHVLARATTLAVEKAVKFIGTLATGGPVWSVGWRRDFGRGLLDQGKARFSILRGSNAGFLADPFPFRHQGRDYVFVEEFHYAMGRGTISVIPFDASGIPGQAQVVLEEPHHLSYPFLFEQDGQVWMIPESGESRTICLYRAVEFPHRWQREAVLIENVAAFDATLLHHGGRIWLMACLRMWQSTSWDMLALYHAGHLTGPWSAHHANPVLFDAASARPAGAVFDHAGALVRPVQDCTRGYGGAINLCRIDRLTEAAFVQTPVGRIQCGPYSCHTLNRHGGLECIDVFGPRALRTVDACYDARADHGRAMPTSSLPQHREDEPLSAVP